MKAYQMKHGIMNSMTNKYMIGDVFDNFHNTNYYIIEIIDPPRIFDRIYLVEELNPVPEPIIRFELNGKSLNNFNQISAQKGRALITEMVAKRAKLMLLGKT